MSGVKFDANKADISLVPPEAILGMAEVLTFGAKKYCDKPIDIPPSSVLSLFSEELEKCFVRIVAVVPFTVKDSVGPATKKIYEKGILNSHSVNYETGMFGPKGIQSALKRMAEKDETTRDVSNCEEKVGERNIYKIWDSPKKHLHYCYKNKIIPAQFAEDILKTAPVIWIMTTTQEKQEDFFVAAATTDLECLVTLSKVLIGRFNISPTSPLQNLLINEKTSRLYFKTTGTRNWEKGMDWSRIYSSLNRHLLAFWGGEDIDPESGLHHLKHVICNAAFILTYAERGSGTDNRPHKALSRGEGELVSVQEVRMPSDTGSVQTARLCSSVLQGFPVESTS